MKNLAALLLCTVCSCSALKAQRFDGWFTDSTLRIDYVFCGSDDGQTIAVESYKKFPHWAGRRHNLDRLLREGNGQLLVTDAASGDTLYRTSFSCLFEEWLTTPEASSLTRSFDHTFLIPCPKAPVNIETTLRDKHRRITARLSHRLDPGDILIRKASRTEFPSRILLQNGPSDKCIDIAILAEGYAPGEMEKFYGDAQRCIEALMIHEPFASAEDRFNFIAVAAPSADSGVSVPHENTWRNTALASHFDTFYSERYLTTTDIKAVHDALAGLPYEHVIVLANTETYGGGGFYNTLALTAADNSKFVPVIVHEFGHSFAGLADEYFYENDVLNDTYDPSLEPWEPNITTLAGGRLKWSRDVTAGVSLPTPADSLFAGVGAIEGAGYLARGMYRPSYDCRMRTNSAEGFCKVCRRAVRETIEYYTE